MLSQRNRVTLLIVWLRMYPTYHLLANMFNISVSAVGTEISSLLPIFCDKLGGYIQWPTDEEWRSMQGIWTKLPMADGAIDGTSHEPQDIYYSGHRHFHCLHTQVICDVDGTIRYVESGYPGHLNDAQTDADFNTVFFGSNSSKTNFGKEKMQKV